MAQVRIPRTVIADGDAIRARRERRGLTTTQLGQLAGGRDGSTIRHLERSTGGTTKAASRVLINQIANALGVDVDELIKQEPAA